MRSSEQGRRWRACAEPPGPPAVPCSPSGSRRQLPAKPRPAQAAYAAANWPLAHAALSADGADVAVAGARGLALYSRRSGRWRLFGDVSQERELAVAHLLWLPRVVAVCAAPGPAPGRGGAGDGRGAALLLYPRLHLDSSSLLARYPLAQARRAAPAARRLPAARAPPGRRPWPTRAALARAAPVPIQL